MNKALYHELNRNKENLHDELDKAILLKNEFSLDDFEIGMKLTALTREKIFKSLINIFKLVRHFKFQEAEKELLLVSKRIKLHLYQMKKLCQTNIAENKKYFTEIIKVLLMIIINEKRRIKI